MQPTDEIKGTGWQRIDKAAFGIVYGAITVLSILMAADSQADEPFKTSAVLFGSTLAITLAKAFAEFLASALEKGERLTRYGWHEAWRHSAPTLAAANLPTLFFIASGIGLIQASTAMLASQAVCVALLATVGTRLGWVLSGSATHAIAGALFSGGIGLLLAVLKYIIH